MCIISVDIPETVCQNTGMNEAATAEFVRRMVAVAYFLRLHQPLADCARIAQMSISDFQKFLKVSGIDSDAIHLLSDLEKGYRSGIENGWHTTAQVRTHRIQKRAKMESI